MTSPEASLSYLERSKFKALMEWLTARCVLHRPDDPAVFCRDLLDRSIQVRRGGRNTPYDPDCAPRLLKECYDDAMNSADEHGIILPDACDAPPIAKRNELSGESSVRTRSKKHVAAPGNDAVLSPSPINAHRSTQLTEKGMGPGIEPTLLIALEDIFEVARPEIAASAVVAGVCKAVHARRAALFKVVDDAGTLREMGAGSVSDQQQRIVNPGKGLVGKAVAAREPVPAVVVSDPSVEEAFCHEVDLPRDPRGASTSRVPPLMYGVLKDSEPSGGVWGVMVAAEPATDGDAFDVETLNTFRVLCDMAAVAMRNAEAFELGERGCEKFRKMVEVMKATDDHLGVNHLLYTITKCLPMICDAQKCTCYLVDDSKNELWVVQSELNIRVPKDKGIVGAVATSGNIENISDVYADPRFNKEVDVATGFQTHSILAMPVRGGEDNRVIAVVQLINKQGPGDTTLHKSCESAAGKHFTAQDTAVIGSFLSLLGPHIFNSTMVKSKKNNKPNRKGGGDQEAFPDRSTGAMKKSTGSVSDFLDARHTLAEEEED